MAVHDDGKAVDHHPRRGAADIGLNRLHYPLNSQSYEFLEEIGRGVSNSVVHKAICIPKDSSVVAIKVIDLRRSKAAFEMATAIHLDHPNILRPYCIFTVKNTLWVVMPFVSGGSLQSLIASSYPHGLPEAFIATVLKQILPALCHLHERGYVHRGIKAGNILIDSITGSVMLSDFGVSTSPSSAPALNKTGNPYWVAPEVIYGACSDIWSFGITALELAHGRSPLSQLSATKSMEITKCFKNMVGLCLDRDPSKRPTAETLLMHFLFVNCYKGPDFLIESMLQQGVVPALEERYSKRVGQNILLKRKRSCKDEGGDGYDSSSASGEIVKHVRTSRWSFNLEGFNLDPVFPGDDDEYDETFEMIKSMEYIKKCMDEQRQKGKEMIAALKAADIEDTGRKEELLQKMQKLLKDEENQNRLYELQVELKQRRMK